MDLVLGEPQLPQSWNRYSYARNNPLLYIDPAGLTVDLSLLSDEDRDTFLEALNEFTGNTYGVNDAGELELVSVGNDSSVTATGFINELIDFNLYKVSPASQGEGSRYDSKNDLIKINFQSFEGAIYGQVDPATFNLGSTFIHEAYHQSSGLFDTKDGTRTGVISNSTDWTGPVVDFVNTIRAERDLPARAAYMVDPMRGHRKKIYFSNVNKNKPAKRFHVIREQ